jgi:UDP-N-acetylmuramyl pentapeptide synthase
MIEITGAQGKTTTAHALAFLMQGPGILHTSTGTYRFPEKTIIPQSSITPASVLAVTKLAHDIRGWLIVEESLGVTCAGDLAIITSAVDYAVASGKKSARAVKAASAKNARHLLLAENSTADCSGLVTHIGDVAVTDGRECRITLPGMTGRFLNPLLLVPGYRLPLMLAAAAAMILGIDPGPLSSFGAIPGRMSVSRENDLLVVDNANSGTNPETTIEAARYARQLSGKEEITLVIGQVAGDGAVCEGFSLEGMVEAIRQIHPHQVVWVGNPPLPGITVTPVLVCSDTFEEARAKAVCLTRNGSVVLAVKTWR